MATLEDVLRSLQRIAPQETAFSFDRVGLQVGVPADPVSVGVVALDASPGLIEFAGAHQAQVAVCHHPVIWDPIPALDGGTRSARLVAELVRRQIAFLACHTNWDVAPGGVNDALATRLDLQDVRPFGQAAGVAHLKLVVFVPKDHESRILDALAEAGAGVVGLYERCAFSSLGQGTFRGTPGSRPAMGESGRNEAVAELRVEMRLPAAKADEVVAALRRVHPYEEPAFDLYPIRELPERPIGRVGRLPAPIRFENLRARADAELASRCWSFGDPKRLVSTVAVCGGAADDEWEAALARGADVFLTGEIRHHVAVEATECGLALLAAGHYATEQPGCLALRDALSDALPSVEWRLYEPPSGTAGRSPA